MYSADKIGKLFPFSEFRTFQKEVLEDIVKSFNSGVEVYLLGAPVGFGKSPAAVCVARMTDSMGTKGAQEPFGAYILTPQNMLVDQYEREKAFKEHISLIKGRDNYGPCHAHKFEDKTCKYGKCQIDESYECEDVCDYKSARDKAKVSQICVSNFVYMLISGSYIFGERDLLIIDEGHSIPTWSLNYVTCTIWSRDLGIPVPELKTFGEYVEWLAKVHGKFGNDLRVVVQRIKELNLTGEIELGLKEQKDKLTEIVDKIDRVLKDYAEFKEEWVFEIVDKGTKKERIQFQPVSSGRFLDKLIYWRGKNKLIMSGTIMPELFIEEAGLSDKVCELKELPSTFPIENRPIYFWDSGKMSLKDRDITLPKMTEHIAVIVKRNEGKKGFLHANSYDIGSKIYSGLIDMGITNVVLQDRDNRDKSLKLWMESKEPTLFISINFTEGVDLKEDLARYQIIAKIGFPYLGDKRVKSRLEMKRYLCKSCGKFYRTTKDMTGAKCSCGGDFELNQKVHVYTCQVCGKKLVSSKDLTNNCSCGGAFDKKTTDVTGEYWYNCQAIIPLVQAYGRGVRSENDTCELWILDSSFKSLYHRYNTAFPKMFKECVKVVK